MSKAIEVELYIGRDNRNTFNIEVTDSESNTRFLKIEMSAEEFALAVTSMHQSCIKATVTGLDKVGKKRVREQRHVFCPLKVYDKKVLSKWLTDNCQEEGWILDTYLGSQTSTLSVDNGTMLNYSVNKWVDTE